MKNRLNTKKLRLAKVKYFDIEHNGIEVNNFDAYVFLYEVEENKYINPFDVEGEYPVFERTPYSNTTKNGEDFGTKVRQLSGDVSESGICYLLTPSDASGLFGTDSISYNTLRDYVLSSVLFFVDRKNIIKEDSSVNMAKKLFIKKNDAKRMKQFREFIETHPNTSNYLKH